MASMRSSRFFDKLEVRVFEDRDAMGHAAAEAVAEAIRMAVRVSGRARVAFAAAPSQDEFLASLAEQPVNWTQVEAFQLDEYVGLPAGHPSLFAEYLTAHLFSRVSIGRIHLLEPRSDPSSVLEEYANLLAESHLDVACLGIGENGHLAFNDPPVADFEDPLPVKRVQLDAVCRAQQVHDGCFARLEDVPFEAITLTLPTLLAAAEIHCVVPGAAKQQAVFRTLHGPVSTDCPASGLRLHDRAVLYLDAAAASGI